MVGVRGFVTGAARLPQPAVDEQRAFLNQRWVGWIPYVVEVVRGAVASVVMVTPSVR